MKRFCMYGIEMWTEIVRFNNEIDDEEIEVGGTEGNLLNREAELMNKRIIGTIENWT